MTNALLQSKLNDLAKLCDEVEAEAKRRYGKNGNLFYEAEGSFHVMDGDSNGYAEERQKHIRFSSATHCNMGCGAW